MRVRVGRMGGTIITVDLPAGSTAGDAIKEGGLNSNGFEIKIGTRVATEASSISDGDMVLLVKKITGA